MNMRLFIAINFPKEIKEEIQKAVRPLVASFPQVSWTKLENIHLTLKFLGNTKENKLVSIKEAVRKVVEGTEPFEVRFDKLGYFDRKQLIIWLRVRSDRKLIDLADRIEKETARLGFARKKRTFSPHITLGRGKRLSREVVKKIKGRIDSFTPGECIRTPPVCLEEISLMQSVLSRQGAIYISLERFALG